MTDPTPPKQLRGKVERVEDSTVIGWFQYQDAPHERVAFELEVNGHAAGRHVADVARKDLARAGIGDGGHSFRITVAPALLGDEEKAHLRLRMVRCGQMVAATLPRGLSQRARKVLPPALAARCPSPPRDFILDGQGRPAPAVAAGPPLRTPELRMVPGFTSAPGATATTSLALLAEAIAALESAPDPAPAMAARLAARDWSGALALGQEDPAAPLFALGHAAALLAMGEMEGAEARLRTALAARETAQTLSWLAHVLELQQRHLEAAALLTRCRAHHPVAPRQLLQCGRMLALAANGGMGVADERPELLPPALGILREAAELMPNDGRPLRDMAQLLMQLDEPLLALEAITLAVTCQPGKAAFLHDKAQILARLDRVEEALEAARKAADTGPQSDGAAAALRLLERWAAARSEGPWRIARLVPAG